MGGGSQSFSDCGSWAVSSDNRSVFLSNNVTVGQYLEMVASRDKDSICRFFVSRFAERYLDPVDSGPGDPNRHGFAIMAISCLMIEALESFFQGWVDSRGRSRDAFHRFFSRWESFSDFRDVSGDFYRHVRCGILHQAETSGGWLVVRKGPLLSGKTVNSAEFVKRLRDVLDGYAEILRSDPWESDCWNCFRSKMDYICASS